MKKIYTALFTLLLTTTYAQIPSVNINFNSTYDTSYKQYIGQQSAPLADGKFLSVYYDYDGDNDNDASTYITKIIRIHPTGKIDPTFTAISTPNLYETKIYTNSDGSFITTGIGTSGFVMKKYNAAAVLDNSFTAPTFTNFVTSSQPHVRFYKVIFQTDGKIFIGGNFNTVNGQNKGGVIRLNANGSVDNTFLSGTGVNGIIFDAVLQSDGKYMAAGSIGGYNGTVKYSIIRINNDGTLDNTFDVVTNSNGFGFANGFDRAILSIVVQTDGKVIPGGSSFYVNNNRIDNIIRLNTNGSRDNTFSSSLTAIYANYMLIQADDKILVKGQYSGISRINSNGSTDTSFNNISTSVGGLNVLEGNLYMTTGDKIIVNSNYRDLNGVTRQGFHRLNSNGSLDFTFNPSFGFNTLYYKTNNTSSNPSITAKGLLDGKILVSGNCYSSYNDIAVGYQKIIRLFPDGQYDSSFSLSGNVYGSINDSQGSMKQQNDGKMIFLNSLNATINSTTHTNLVRLNYDGSLDTSFVFADIYAVTVFQPLDQGKFLATGTGLAFQSGNRYKILRFNSDGSLDTTFNSPLMGTSYKSIEVQSDGKILVCGVGFSGNTGTSVGPADSLQRLNPDGSIDTSFQLPALLSYINHTKIQPDGKILLNYKYGSQTRIARINQTDASLDNSFNTINCSYLSIQGDIPYIPIAVLNSGEIYLNAPNANGSYNGTANTKSIIVANANGTFLHSYGDKPGKFFIQGCDRLVFYSVKQNIDNSERNDLVQYALTSNPSVNPPSGSMSQSFTSGQTLGNLVVNGQNILWYSSQSNCVSTSADRNINSADSLLPASTPLVNGTTYYASQTIDGIESTYRLPITVNLNLATNAYQFESVSLFPNPVKNSLSIENVSTIDKVEIYNSLGQMIGFQEEHSKNYNFNLNSYSNGIYFFKLYADNTTKIIKVVKE